MPQTDTIHRIQYVNKVRVGADDYELKAGVTNVHHGDLLALRNSGELCGWYRIIDYMTITTQEDTQSAGHHFDIIVHADDPETLNENAYAIPRSNDEYFTVNGANLAAWELKYCLDNDTHRFEWADPVNGKGVIYYMKDEFGNECPYDFKNIMFKRKITLESGYPELDLEGGEETWCYTFTATKYDLTNDEWSGIIDGSLESPHEHMSDENTSTYHHNIIKEYIPIYNDDEDRSKVGLMYLNNNVFLGYFEYNGDEDSYQSAYCSHSNNFGNNCYSNTFGNNCHDTTFGNNCYDNTFGSDCYNITFGSDCYNNTFGNNCYGNTFGKSCYSNTFGKNCNNNTFGDYCRSNTFGDYCADNTFGDYCYNITFGDYCYNITFGDNCYGNTFGSSKQSPQSYCNNIIFESGNRNINLVCSQTTSDSTPCRNILVSLGVNNGNTKKTITITEVNQTHKTIVKTANDVEITA